MFFQSIEKFVKVAPITVSLSMDGDQMTVVIVPKSPSSTVGIKQPLYFKGTAQELDEQLVPALDGIGAQYTDLKTMIEAEKQAVEDAKVKKAAELAKAKTKPAKAPVKPSVSTVPVVGEQGDDDDVDGIDSTESGDSKEPDDQTISLF